MFVRAGVKFAAWLIEGGGFSVLYLSAGERGTAFYRPGTRAGSVTWLIVLGYPFKLRSGHSIVGTAHRKSKNWP